MTRAEVTELGVCPSTYTSISPGTRNFPEPSILSASLGRETLARNPADRIRDPETTTTESVIGGPPLPSMRTAPMIACTLEDSGGLTLHPQSVTARTKAES